jgi:hypothetical protein
MTTLTFARVSALPLHTLVLARPETLGRETTPAERVERLHGEFALEAVRGVVAFAREEGFAAQS